MKYNTVLVPNCLTLRNSTLEILEKFKARGGRVIFAGGSFQNMRMPIFLTVAQNWQKNARL